MSDFLCLQCVEHQVVVPTSRRLSLHLFPVGGGVTLVGGGPTDSLLFLHLQPTVARFPLAVVFTLGRSHLRVTELSFEDLSSYFSHGCIVP